jgi:hypothetical protein
MRRSIAWPIAGVVALAIVVYGITAVNAQRDPPREGFGRMPPQVGRFAVAHAGPERIVILDTATGQLYAGYPKDLKALSELPKVGELGRQPLRRGEEGERPRDKDREKPREREKPKEGKEAEEREKRPQ